MSVYRDTSVLVALLTHDLLSARTPDALHLAIVQRTGTTLMTFDAKMSGNARILGMDLADA